MPERKMTDAQALDSMAEWLSGREWQADDLEVIAGWIEDSGREVAEPQEAP
jgi:hypothetical protein